MSQDEELDKILVQFFNKAEEDVHSSNFTREGLLITKAHTQAKQTIQTLYSTREATLIREALSKVKQNYGQYEAEIHIEGQGYIGLADYITELTNQQKGEQ